MATESYSDMVMRVLVDAGYTEGSMQDRMIAYVGEKASLIGVANPNPDSEPEG